LDDLREKETLEVVRGNTRLHCLKKIDLKFVMDLWRERDDDDDDDNYNDYDI
jgi:hypothetical protein